MRERAQGGYQGHHGELFRGFPRPTGGSRASAWPTSCLLTCLALPQASPSMSLAHQPHRTTCIYPAKRLLRLSPVPGLQPSPPRHHQTSPVLTSPLLLFRFTTPEESNISSLPVSFPNPTSSSSTLAFPACPQPRLALFQTSTAHLPFVM